MPQDRICKTIRQYSKGAIPNEDMEKLQEIADDYAKVKQYVYARYGGIGGLAKIYPGYTVQNEMTASGFRQELGMPSVYFYLAVFEALGDIRGRWEQTKAKVRQLAGRNENLTDNNQYGAQLYIRLYPEEQRVEINVPVYMQVRRHADYRNQVGISLGMYTMLTTDQGHRYGDELGKYQLEYADWIRKQARSYLLNRDNNPGRKKYYAKKKRLEEQLHGYINQELNRFLREEKPRRVYIVKYPKPQGGGLNRKINHSVNMWQRGYIRSRLELKCREQEVELAEVLGKDISRECSNCGAMGNKKDGLFHCEACGQSMDEKWNTAGNVLKRGLEGKILH